MDVKIKTLPKSQVELLIEIPSKKMGGFLDKAITVLSKDLKLKGFRPGKVPKDVAEKHIDSKAILEKGAEIAVQETYPQAILENHIEAIGLPKVEILKIARKNPLIFKAQVAVLPKVKLGDYKNIKAKKREIGVGEDEVASALDWLRKSRAKYITVSRPCQKGDRVEVDFESFLVGVPLEDGSSKNHPLILGEGKFVPGFEDNVEGMKQDEEKNFSITFPQDYYKKDLAGQKIDFKVKMELVQKVELPELNDEFSKNLGEFPNLESLKKSIKDGLWREKEQKETQRFREEILEKIVEKSAMELPDVLIESELDKMVKELEVSLKNMGLELEVYLEKIKKTVEDLKKDWRDMAQKRLKAALALREIAAKEDMSISDEEIKERINRDVLSQYSSEEEARKSVNMDEVEEYMRGAVRNEKTLELLEKIAIEE